MTEGTAALLRELALRLPAQWEGSDADEAVELLLRAADLLDNRVRGSYFNGAYFEVEALLDQAAESPTVERTRERRQDQD